MTPDRETVVVRLVYDGPPRSGKTTSLRALAEGMGRALFSPAESDGNTLYFDWLEYTGGNFDGSPIHCQILSVPGQEELAARRNALLAEADAVVFVLNGTPEHLPAAAAHLRELQAFLAAQPPPHPGIIVQANQRDRPDALPLAAVREALGVEGLALVESVAIESQGIREAFVLSVRLALDRVRELLAQGRLPSDSGAADVPAELLAKLQGLEEDAPQAPSLAGTRGSRGVPRLPDSTAPVGRVWPPVDGRIVLHSAASPDAVPRRTPDGSWRFFANNWHFHSAPRHEFERLDEAKEELLSWAQGHAAGFDRLSPQRCIALAESGLGTWRLWQIVHAQESVQQRLKAALRTAGDAGVEEALATSVALLLAARKSFRNAPPLPCRLDMLGETQGRPLYLGLLPPRGWEPAQELLAMTGTELVEREIRPLLRGGPPAAEETLTALLSRA
jgi:signal recognition particle receptor subunit beta